MHIYFYDTFVNQKKYDALLARVETRITDLGLNGKIIRLGLTNSIGDNVRNEIKKGAKTITIVGDDTSMNAAVNAVAKAEAANITQKPLPIGIIPVGKKNNLIAGYLGIGSTDEACDILSARRVQRVDLGLANKTYFLAHAIIDGGGTAVEIDNNYTIETAGAGLIGVVNLPIGIDPPSGVSPRANDNILELFIKAGDTHKYLPLNSRQTGQSIFSFRKLKITNKSAPVKIDGVISMKTPVEISVAKEKVYLIVGKGRKF